MTPQLAEKLTIHEPEAGALGPAIDEAPSPGGRPVRLPARQFRLVQGGERTIPWLLRRERSTAGCSRWRTWSPPPRRWSWCSSCWAAISSGSPRWPACPSWSCSSRSPASMTATSCGSCTRRSTRRRRWLQLTGLYTLTVTILQPVAGRGKPRPRPDRRAVGWSPSRRSLGGRMRRPVGRRQGDRPSSAAW